MRSQGEYERIIEMEFKQYQHIERFGTMEVEGIEIGTCHVFPKIDGTNGSVWMENDSVWCGSRKRPLTIESDNAGFLIGIYETEERFKSFFIMYPNIRLFGEWLVPHSLKTYWDDAWRKFYVFDVVQDLLGEEPSGEKFKYLITKNISP